MCYKAFKYPFEGDVVTENIISLRSVYTMKYQRSLQRNRGKKSFIDMLLKGNIGEVGCPWETSP